ncbi:MAG TPA: pirin family protein [Polyangiaceae bacterium]|nr:pirin family protein [Polyangiaceae bacterium]
MTIETTSQTAAQPRPSSLGDAPRPREVDSIYRAPAFHWVGDGFRVAGYFSAIPDAHRLLSPFLLLDYHPEHRYPPTETPRGVGVHPHRGFETVTIAFQGSVAHHDSAGHGGVIGPGDVQWMTAASGILHKEYHEASYAKVGGPFQMAQLWVNLPRAHKMDPPRYQGITSEQIGVAVLPNDAGIVRVIAGEYRGAKGPARTFTPINLFHARVAAGKSVDFEFPETHNTAVLVMKGEITIGDEKAKLHDFVLFERGSGKIEIHAAADTELLVMDGEPIDEPVVAYGPFVMTSEREIYEAVRDFSAGKFGHLDD